MYRNSLAVILSLLSFALCVTAHAQSPDVNGTAGQVLVNGENTPFADSGVILRAKTRPYVVAQTGTANASSSFIVFNSANAELLRVRGDGAIVLGGAAGSAWGGALSPSIEYYTSSVNFGDVGEIMLTSNAYWAPEGAWRYRIHGHAANYYLYQGRHQWRVAPQQETFNPAADVPWKTALTIVKDGKVGVGTQAPDAALHVHGTADGTLLRVNNGNGFGLSIRDLQPTSGTTHGVLLQLEGNSSIRVSNSLDVGGYGLPRITSNESDLQLNPTGGRRVVIGTEAANANLYVYGTIEGAKVLGAVFQDVAEWVRSEEALTDGTVVAVAAGQDDHVVASARAYDPRVAGVVSPNPGLLLGVAGEGKYKIATTGRVKVKVDASSHPIGRGDLLVTSDKPGTAMKSIPLDLGGTAIHRPGTLIGKALEPLASGEGEILVLLSLQ
jgi:hypothetical protein